MSAWIQDPSCSLFQLPLSLYPSLSSKPSNHYIYIQHPPNNIHSLPLTLSQGDQSAAVDFCIAMDTPPHDCLGLLLFCIFCHGGMAVCLPITILWARLDYYQSRCPYGLMWVILTEYGRLCIIIISANVIYNTIMSHSHLVWWDWKLQTGMTTNSKIFDSRPFLL